MYGSMVGKMHAQPFEASVAEKGYCLTNPVVIAVAGQAQSPKPKPIQANFKPIPGDFITNWRLPS